MTTYEIDWENNIFFPLYGSAIIIPANTILWRGCDPQFPLISNRPAYYGSQSVSQGYADKYNTGALPFITTRPLELLDYRYMKVLLSQLFEHNAPHTKSDEEIIKATTVSFGLCSLQHQVKLIKNRYKAIYNSKNAIYNSIKLGIQNLQSLIKPDSIYEQQGYRIAETTNDAIVMGFIKEIFNNKYDGFISPKLSTPFHIEKNNFLNSELILFEPIHSGIKLLNTLPRTVKKVKVDSFILQSRLSYTTIDVRGMELSYYNKKGGGKTNSSDLCDDYNYLYDINNTHIVNLYNTGLEIGKRWNRKSIKLRSAVAPVPCVDPSIFII
jgi:hypothetical protein